MDTTKLQQEQRIERYILNKMTDEEATAFEIEYLPDQACIEQLEVAEKLYQGLHAIANSDSAEVTPRTNHVSSPHQHSTWWQKNVPLWSLAATLVLMLLPLGLLFNPQTTSTLPASAVSVIHVEMSGFRGENTTQTSTVVQNQLTLLATYIDIERTDLFFPFYTLKLQHKENGIPALAIVNVQRNQDSMLYFNLGQNTLKNGDYQFSILGQTTSGGETLLKTGALSIKQKP